VYRAPCTVHRKPLNMKPIRLILLLLLAGFFLLSQTACVYYQRYPIAKARLPKVNPEGLSVYILDAAHPLTRGWYMSEPKFEKNSISGFISKMAEVETLEASMLRDRSDAQQSRNDVLIYIKPQVALGLPDTATLSIQAAQLEKIEVCELNHVKTIGLPLISCVGFLGLIYLISGADY
jgi:hypothetical protein